MVHIDVHLPEGTMVVDKDPKWRLDGFRCFGVVRELGTASFGHGTLIFEFSRSKIGGYQLFNKIHTHLGEKIQKRPKKLRLCVKTAFITPAPPPKNAHT